MVAIRHREADGLLSKPLGHIGFYLFYGTDTGLVNERLRNVVLRSIDDPSDAFQLVRIDGDELAGDPGRLADELNTIGLFGGRRAIWIKAGGKAFISALEHLMAKLPTDAIVLVEAGNLKKDSALRKLFERERLAVAVECEHDDQDQIRALIQSEATTAGLTIDAETVGFISRSLGADRRTTRMELDKLVLYAHGSGRITEADVEAILADASVTNMDAAIQAAFSGSLDRTDEAAQQVLATGDAGVLLSNALRYAVMLHRARLDVSQGASRDAAIEKALRRAYIFPNRRVVAQQLEIWTPDMLTRAISILGRAIHESRRDARLSDTTATRAFWTIAAAARRGRKT